MATPTSVYDDFSVPELTIGDVLGALCLALDLTEGQPPGHCLRSCYIGSEIAAELGLNRQASETVFYTCLLKDLGCSSNAARICQLYLTDDRDFKYQSSKIDHSSIRQALTFVLRQTGADSGLVERVKAISNIARNGEEIVTEIFETRCQQGADIALQMGFSQAVADGISALDEHWDGGGRPLRLVGSGIPLQSRIALVAQVMDVFASTGGPEAALSELAMREGRWFDPLVVRAAHSVARRPGFWEARSAAGLADRIFALEPAQSRWALDEKRLDEIVMGFAKVVDAKSPFTHGHSTRVALYTDLITEQLGYSRNARRWMWRTALMHDIGKLGVSNLVLDKPGKLTDEEFAQIKRHPGLGQEILARIDPLAQMATIVAAHHERLDGGGYPYGLCASQLSADMRILTVADVFDALSADRPYRGAMPLSKVWQTFDEMTGSAVDGEIVEVLQDAVRKAGGMGLAS